MKTTFFLLVSTIVVFEFVSGFSSSRACTIVNGQQECTEHRDPNGNSAAAGAFSNGVNGYRHQYANAGQEPQYYPGSPYAYTYPVPYQPYLGGNFGMPYYRGF